MDVKPSWLDLERVIPLASKPRKKKGGKQEETAEPKITAEQITSLSADSLKRLFPDKIRQLSERRCGMKMKDALHIAEGTN
jgi:hypothetical protein